jgi:hypothetical protein
MSATSCDLRVFMKDPDRYTPYPVGAENCVTLCDLLVFMDESAETITPKDANIGAKIWPGPAFR